MSTASFNVSTHDAFLIRSVIDRCRDLELVGRRYPILEATMDLTACHANGCPLDLERMIGADPVHLAHDLLGIRTHIDRETGRLSNGFSPRLSAPREPRKASA